MFINTAKRIFKNTGIQAVGSIWNTLIGLLITGSLARYLGKTGYGEYSLVFIYLYFSTVIAYFGFDSILLRELSKEKDKKSQNRLLLATIMLKLTFSLFAISLTLLYLSFIHYPQYIKSGIIIVNLTLIIGAVESVEAIFKVHLKMVYSVISSVVSQLLHLLFIYLAITMKMSLPYLILAYLFARVFRIIIVYYSSRRFIEIYFDWDWQTALFILKNSFLLGIANVLWIIYFRIDNIMLDFMKGTESVGQYNAAYKFVDMALLFSGMMMTSIFPLLSERYPHDIAGFKRIYQKSIDYTSLIGATMTLLIILLSPYLIISIFGSQFHESILTLQILGLVPLLIFLNNALGHIMLILGMQGKPLILLMLFGVFINVSANWLLIPISGSNGAAIATVVSEFISLILMFWIITPKIDFSPSMRIPIFIGTAILIACVTSYLIPYNHFNAVAGFLIYALIIVISVPINWKEIREIFIGFK